MKKETKHKIVKELEESFEQNHTWYLVDYKQMPVSRMVELRKLLKRNNFRLKVVKNRLALKAIGQRFPELKPYFQKNNALAFTDSDPIALAKILQDFSDRGKVLEIKAGVIEGHYLAPEMFSEIIKLNSKMDLIGRVGYLISYPLSQLLRTLQTPLVNMGRLLSVLKDRKES